MMAQEESLVALQNQWKEIFQRTLPKAAMAKSPTQKKWPVTLDHCFARIILDKTIGIDTPWTTKLKPPAYKNMSSSQLSACIDLGNKILQGEVDLVELDNQSLAVRGKASKPDARGIKRRGDIDEEEEMKAVKKRFAASPLRKIDAEEHPSTRENSPTTSKLLLSISKSSKTPFQKKVLSLLLQIPRGRYTTYAAISTYLASSPRAVGGALKNNTWAPQVPCHRVLAADGGIGGFFGSWGRNGKAGENDDKKRTLLREEGIRFDGKGRVVGSAWSGFAE